MFAVDTPFYPRFLFLLLIYLFPCYFVYIIYYLFIFYFYCLDGLIFSLETLSSNPITPLMAHNTSRPHPSFSALINGSRPGQPITFQYRFGLNSKDLPSTGLFDPCMTWSTLTTAHQRPHLRPGTRAPAIFIIEPCTHTVPTPWFCSHLHR